MCCYNTTLFLYFSNQTEYKREKERAETNVKYNSFLGESNREVKNRQKWNAFFSFWDKEIYLAYPELQKEYKIGKKLRDTKE